MAVPHFPFIAIIITQKITFTLVANSRIQIRYTHLRSKSQRNNESFIYSQIEICFSGTLGMAWRNECLREKATNATRFILFLACSLPHLPFIAIFIAQKITFTLVANRSATLAFYCNFYRTKEYLHSGCEWQCHTCPLLQVS